MQHESHLEVLQFIRGSWNRSSTGAMLFPFMFPTIQQFLFIANVLQFKYHTEAYKKGRTGYFKIVDIKFVIICKCTCMHVYRKKNSLSDRCHFIKW